MTLAHIGYRRGAFADPGRLSWDADAPRPIAWSAWYPAADSGQVPVAVPGVFAQDPVLPDAPLHGAERFPVVLMSHGTGGAPEGLGWLACRLAALGFVVLGAHHHGNTGGEPYCIEGFTCWWERSADLSVLLDHLAAKGPFAGRLDLSRVHALGFSLGAHTVFALAGAITSMERFQHWAVREGRPLTGPRELPFSWQEVRAQLQRSPTMQASWDRQGLSYENPHLRSVCAIAPPPTVRAFSAQSLKAIARPVTLLTGGADVEAPTAQGAAWLAKLNSSFQHHDLGPAVGHYTFLGQAVGDVPPDMAFLFTDPDGLERAQVHDQTCAAVLATFAPENERGRPS